MNIMKPPIEVNDHGAHKAVVAKTDETWPTRFRSKAGTIRPVFTRPLGRCSSVLPQGARMPTRRLTRANADSTRRTVNHRNRRKKFLKYSAQSFARPSASRNGPSVGGEKWGGRDGENLENRNESECKRVYIFESAR